MTARDLLSSSVVTGIAEERLRDVADRIHARAAHHCVVVEDDRFVGVIRLDDLAAHTFAGNRILADLVSPHPPVMVMEHEPAAEIARLFEQHRLVDAIVLSPSGAYVGLISSASVFEWLYREHQAAHQELQDLLSERERIGELLVGKVEQRTSELRNAVEQFRGAALSLSHDVRSPLRRIQVLAEELATGICGVITADGIESARSIQRTAAKVEQLSEDILLKAQRVFASSAPRWETIDLNVVLDDALDFHRPLLDQRAAVVTKRGSLHTVAGRYVPLLQIVSNLLANAVKYVPNGRQPHIEVWSDETPDKITFCMKDNGRGLAQGDHGRIFEPFVRVGAVDGDGLGLGLAITSDAVQEVGGRIMVDSELGAGSIFSVSFMKAAALPSVQEAAINPDAPHSGFHGRIKGGCTGLK